MDQGGAMAELGKLTSAEEFPRWLTKLETLLTGCNLVQHINGMQARPASHGEIIAPLTSAQIHWDREEDRVLQLLYHSVSDEIQERLQEMGWTIKFSCRETLKNIERAAFQPLERKMGDTMLEFFRLEAHFFHSLTSYASRLALCWSQIKLLWPDTPDQMYVSKAIQGLRFGYPKWYDLWKSRCSLGRMPSKAEIDKFLVDKTGEDGGGFAIRNWAKQARRERMRCGYWARRADCYRPHYGPVEDWYRPRRAAAVVAREPDAAS